ncbi:MAG: urease accessory protein UreD [Alphaproteobacteria bacterium]
MQPHQRSAGRIDAAFAHGVRGTTVARAYQSGCARLRFPRQHGGMSPTGIVINTAGGLTGGDRFHVAVDVAAGAAATLSGQAAEKIYRSAGGVAEMRNALRIGAGARLDWLPQETILFDRAALDRRTEVTMAADATLTATELTVLGRAAMGERVRHAILRDRWRIVRDGRPVFADSLRLDGAVDALLDRPAAAAGGSALALVVHVAPDAERRLDPVRDLLDGRDGVRSGASAYDGLLVVRMIAVDAAATRQAALAVMGALRDGLPPPRPWLL